MAKTVYDTLELELQDGTLVTIRPLSIKLLRQFMKIMAEMKVDGTEDENLDVLVRACGIALQKQAPKIANNFELLEDALDIPTMWKIVEIAGGVKMSDPNLLMEAGGQVGTT